VYNADGQLCKTVRIEGDHAITEYYAYLSPGVRSRKVTETHETQGGKLVGLDTVAYVQGLEFHASYTGTDMSYNGETVTGAETTQQWTTTRIISDHGQVGKITKNDTSNTTTVTYNALNHLDSNEVVLDEQGNLVRYTHYAPYGETLQEEVLDAEQIQDEWGYSGEEEDSTGLLAYGYRYYQKNGIWNRADPIRFESGQLNLYAMVNGNPVTWRDEKGLYFEGDGKFYTTTKSALEMKIKSLDSKPKLQQALKNAKGEMDSYNDMKSKGASIKSILDKYIPEGNEELLWDVYGKLAATDIIADYYKFKDSKHSGNWQEFQKEINSFKEGLIQKGAVSGGLEHLITTGVAKNNITSEMQAELNDLVNIDPRGMRALYRKMWGTGSDAPIEALVNFGTYHDIPEWHDHPQFVNMLKRLIKAGVQTGNVVHVHKENTSNTNTGKYFMTSSEQKDFFKGTKHKVDLNSKEEQYNLGFEMIKQAITDAHNELGKPEKKIEVHYFGNDHHLETKDQIVEAAQEHREKHIHIFLKGSQHFSGTKDAYENSGSMLKPNAKLERKLRYVMSGRGALPSAYGNGAYLLEKNTAVVWLTEDTSIKNDLRNKLGLEQGKLGYMEYEQPLKKKRTRLETPLEYKTKDIEKPQFKKDWDYTQSAGHIALNSAKNKLVLVQANGVVSNQPPLQVSSQKIPHWKRRKSESQLYEYDISHEDYLIPTPEEMRKKMVNQFKSELQKTMDEANFNKFIKHHKGINKVQQGIEKPQKKKK